MVGLNRFRFGFNFFFNFFLFDYFFYKNQTEPKIITSNLNSKLIHFQKSCQPRVNPHSQNIA